MSVAGFLARKAAGAQIRLARTVKLGALDTALLQPVVSFSFDDFPRSALTQGGRMLKAAGWAGTYFVAGTFCGRTVDGIEYFEREDLIRADEDGHEIGCHTFGHLRLPDQRASVIGDDLARNAAFVRDILPHAELASFAYPYGDLRLAQKRLVSRRFPISRGIWPGLNTGRMDFAQLRSVALERRTLDSLDIDGWLDRAMAANGWLIFFTHDVSDDPSPYGCDRETFARVIEKIAACGIKVMPVKNAAGFARFAAGRSVASPRNVTAPAISA